jgi:prevent-host-death family protein
MPTLAEREAGTRVVSVLNARANLGKLLDRIDDKRGSLVIEKRGTPRAVLLSIRDYVKLAAPEPEILRIVGEISERNGTDKLTSRQIDAIIKQARAERKKR